MADASDLLETLQGMDVKAIAISTIEETKEIAADLNATQMYEGLRSDGTEILPTYSDLTIEIKQEKGQVSDRVTLRDTGAHYAGLYVEVHGEELESGSRDEKSEKLQKKYGEKIYGLGEEKREEWVEGFLRPLWEQKVENESGLKFS